MGDGGQRLGGPHCQGTGEWHFTEREKEIEKKKKPRVVWKNQAGAEWSRGSGAVPGVCSPPSAPPSVPLLYQFHVVGGEHAKVAVGAVATPPALIDHLDVGDDVLRIKGDLSVIS